MGDGELGCARAAEVRLRGRRGRAEGEHTWKEAAWATLAAVALTGCDIAVVGEVVSGEFRWALTMGGAANRDAAQSWLALRSALP